MAEGGLRAASPNSTTCITTRRASPTPIRRSSRWRIAAAADAAGIALTLLPVFYAHAGFGGAPPTAGQRRFVHTIDSFARLCRARCASAPPSTATCSASRRTACAPSRRTSSGRSCASRRGCAPIHIHAAEQTREVDDCYRVEPHAPGRVAARRTRDVDARWCVVHATHMTEREIAALAASGAVAGLAPTTEADLGDGTFPGAAYLAAQRPLRRRQRFEHRDRRRSRSCASSSGRSACARAAATCCAATAGLPVGHVAVGCARRVAARRRWRQPDGAIAPGCRADLVVLERRRSGARRCSARRTCSMPRSSAPRASRCAT